jgi:hypothetical protein
MRKNSCDRRCCFTSLGLSASVGCVLLMIEPFLFTCWVPVVLRLCIDHDDGQDTQGDNEEGQDVQGIVVAQE